MMTAIPYTSPYNGEQSREAPCELWALRRETAQQLRRLTENLLTRDLDGPTLSALLETLAAQNTQLDGQPEARGREAQQQAYARRSGSAWSLDYELNALDGRSNPQAPPVDITLNEQGATGRVRLGWQHEGPPGAVHGGVVAAVFDQLLGVAQMVTDQPGVTGRLTVKYHKPTPIDTELTLTAKVEQVDGRKNRVSGQLWAGERLTASCEGLFVHIDPEAFRQIRDG